MPPKKSQSLYSPHPGIAMMQKWIAELPAKTGRSLEQWLALIHKEGPADEAERRRWLKEAHGHGTNSAWWLAERSCGKGAEDTDPALYLQAAERYVEEMFANRAALRPLYDELLKRGLRIAKDVKACPCKTIVPLYRNHVFAQIKPATRTRIDLGFALKDTPARGRLIDTGGRAKGDRITHRIPITQSADIDDEVVAWLRKAYDLDA
jgi:hypothetical protein